MWRDPSCHQSMKTPFSSKTSHNSLCYIEAKKLHVYVHLKEEDSDVGLIKSVLMDSEFMKPTTWKKVEGLVKLQQVIWCRTNS